MLRADVKLSLVERALNTLRKPDLRPAWKEARAPLREDIKDHRKKKEGPDGTWAPRASSTNQRRMSSRKGRPRNILGRLPTALKTQSDRRRVAMISRVKWSGAQQDGDVVGHGARLPARVFLWASDHVVEVISAIVVKTLAAAFGKAK